ncbi:MAG: BACON domain-containing protein, partial [Anaerolineaceae bacterium]
NGQSVDDPAAWGGTAYRLYPGGGESSAWVWDTTFIKDVPMTAYFRLKVNDNNSNGEVARVTVKGGGREYGPLRLSGNDFTAANEYQEFALDFTFHDNENEPFLIFQFWRSGSADVYVDAVSIFSEPQAIRSPLVWPVPGGNYRGQGVWVRYTDGSQFSAIAEAATSPPAIHVSPSTLNFLAVRSGSPPPISTLNVTTNCSAAKWQVSSDAPWLHAQAGGSIITVGVNQSGLSNGLYAGTVTVSAVDDSTITPVSVPVRLTVVEELFSNYLPHVQ